MSEDLRTPYSIEAEQAFLGALLIDPEAVHKVRGIVEPEDLYVVRHQWIYQDMLALADRGENRDYITLCDELERKSDRDHGDRLVAIGGAAYLTSLINACPTSLNIESYAATIVRTAVLRRLIEAGTRVMQIGRTGLHPVTREPLEPQEAIAEAERILIETSGNHTGIGIRPKTFDEVICEIRREQIELAEGKKVEGIDPILPSLRAALPFGVLQRGWNVGVGANPKMGKSLYAANVVVKALVDGKNVAMLGTEMLAKENGYRMVPMVTHYLQGIVPGITTAELLKQVYGPIDKGVKQRVIANLDRLLEWLARCCQGNLLIVDEPLKVSELRALLAREQITWGQFDLVVVDHIGMMLPEGKVQSETQRMNEISSDLLKLSKSSLLSNPTLLFVSPFTKGEPSDLPGMHRFRDTFMLAHNAHLLLGVYEDAAGGKLLHIAGMRSSNGQGDISRNIPISIRKEDGVIVEETPRPHLL
jgi:replicative DNA helicase